MQLLPTNLDGCRCIELGCGAGDVSSWMARRDGQDVGIDPAANQLKTASRFEEQYQLGIEFVEGFCVRCFCQIRVLILQSQSMGLLYGQILLDGFLRHRGC